MGEETDTSTLKLFPKNHSTDEFHFWFIADAPKNNKWQPCQTQRGKAFFFFFFSTQLFTNSNTSLS